MGALILTADFRAAVVSSPFKVLEQLGPATLTPGPPLLPLLLHFLKVSWGEGRDFLLESYAKKYLSWKTQSVNLECAG